MTKKDEVMKTFKCFILNKKNKNNLKKCIDNFKLVIYN